MSVESLSKGQARKILRSLRTGSVPSAESVGADLLVMGAYSHSHEHESVFGGATQYVVDQTGMPVVMVH